MSPARLVGLMVGTSTSLPNSLWTAERSSSSRSQNNRPPLPEVRQGTKDLDLRVRLRAIGFALAPGYLAGTPCICHLVAILPFSSATPKRDRFGSRALRIKAGSYEEVVTVTGLAKPSVIARATRLRKAGVKLPKYGRAKRSHRRAGAQRTDCDAEGLLRIGRRGQPLKPLKPC